MLTKEQLLRDAWFKRIGYSPHPEQNLFHNSTARFRIPCCGRRFGKSMMSAKDLEPKLLQPNKRFWIVGPTYSLAEKEFRVIWEDLIIKLKLGKDPRIEKSYSPKQGNMYINFKDRNTILEVKSADNTDTLVGDALDGVIMSEAAKHKPDTWDKYIRPALSDKRGFADFPTTPEGFNWYYDLWLLGRDKTLIKNYESWRFPSWKNTFSFPDGELDDEIKLLRRTMTKEAFEQEIAADFSSFVGKIYPEWDVNVHVSKQEFVPGWPNYIAFDWGYTNPLAAVEFQVSPFDTIHIWRLHYKSHTMLEDHLNMMKSREQPNGYHINLCFGDAADPEAVMTVNRHFAPCIADPNAKTNWRDGVDLVRSFLERSPGEDEYGGPLPTIPALFVDPECIDLIREFNNYRSPESASGKNVTEMAIKQDDHALDALRYGLVHIYRLGATSSLGAAMDFSSETKTAPVVTQEKIATALNGQEVVIKSNPDQALPGVINDISDLFSSVGASSSDDSGFFTTLGEF